MSRRRAERVERLFGKCIVSIYSFCKKICNVFGPMDLPKSVSDDHIATRTIAMVDLWTTSVNEEIRMTGLKLLKSMTPAN